MHKKTRVAVAIATIGFAALGLTACNEADSTKESTTMEMSGSMTPSDAMMSDSMKPSDAMMSDSMTPL